MRMQISPDFLLRRLRLRHLQLVVLLAREGSLRSAASALNLTQPAVSKMLREIEQVFGGPLFERGRRGVEPTATGRALVHHARVVLGDVDRAAAEIEALREGASATLRLGTMSITSIVPAAIVDLCARMPDARVRIREGAMRELLPQLREGALDCVFGSIAHDAMVTELMDVLDVEVIFADRLGAIADERHALAGAGRVAWQDLAGQRWVTPPRDTLLREQFVAAFVRVGRAPPDPVVETLSPVTTVDLLRRDPGLLGLVRDETAAFALMNGLRRLEIVKPMPLPPLCALTRRTGVAQTPVVAGFVEALRRAARQLQSRKRRSARAGGNSSRPA